MYVVTPKNKTEQKKFEREIKKTGTIKADYQIADANNQVSGISPIVEEEISPIVDSTGNPIRKTPKKAANVSSKRSRSRSRQ
jgi:hypothetical protein